MIEISRSLTSLGAAALLATTAIVALPTPSHADDITLQLWSRADRSGPLRAANILTAAEQLNRMLEAAGSGDRVVVEVFENNADGFDSDALDLFKAFAVDRGPDMFVAAHEWIGAFVEEGLAYRLDEHIDTNNELYGDVIERLWTAVEYKGGRYGIPQDSEIRMFFYDKDMLRQIGKDEAFIEGLPEAVESGDFTIYDMTDLAKEVVEGGAAKYGIVHRPNVGPDFQMLMKSFGIDQFNAEEGKLQISEAKLADFFEWLKYSVDQGVIPANMTAWSWDEVHASFRTEKSAFIKFHGIWNVPAQLEARGLDKDTYFDEIGWTHSPAAEEGGEPANLSHPIVYVVSAKSEHPELAAYIIGLASQNVLNTEHAVTTGHTPINYGQAAMPRFIEEGWALRAATPMLEYASFMPNHAMIGQYNALVFKGIEGVETGRLDPKDAAAFVVEELQAELGDELIVLD